MQTPTGTPATVIVHWSNHRTDDNTAPEFARKSLHVLVSVHDAIRRVWADGQDPRQFTHVTSWRMSFPWHREVV